MTQACQEEATINITSVYSEKMMQKTIAVHNPIHELIDKSSQ